MTRNPKLFKDHKISRHCFNNCTLLQMQNVIVVFVTKENVQCGQKIIVHSISNTVL